MNRGPQGGGNPAQHAQGMALVRRRFEPADLLLRRLEFAGQFFLGNAGTFPQGGDLERHIPSFTRFFKAFCKAGILQLPGEILVKVRFHFSKRFRQFRIRSRSRKTLR